MTGEFNMTNNDIENRLIEIEIALANQERVVEDLNQVIIEQGKHIDKLQKQIKYLVDNVDVNVVKPLSEETPPPHY